VFHGWTPPGHTGEFTALPELTSWIQGKESRPGGIKGWEGKEIENKKGEKEKSTGEGREGEEKGDNGLQHLATDSKSAHVFDLDCHVLVLEI